MVRVCLGLLALLFSATAFSEGSWQVGLTQSLAEYDLSYTKFSTPKHPQYVIFTSATEVVNVSLCGSSSSANDNVYFEVWSADGATRYYTSPNAVKETQTGFCSFTAANYPTALNPPAGFKWSPSTSQLPAGTYQLRLFNGSWKDDQNRSLLSRFDITVTPNATTPPNPKLAAGRVFAYNWAFNAKRFTSNESTSADYYILVPGGRPNTNFVWLLDLNNFAGFIYDLVANDSGVDAANVLYSVPRAGNSVTEKYPMYLGYPVNALPPPTQAPQLSNVTFTDSDGVDQTISPGGTAGVQDTGVFKFTSDVPGRYLITIDANQDGVFGSSIVVNGSAVNDVYLFGAMVAGANSVVWNGRDNKGAVLPDGVYQAQVQGRIGEYHFVAGDAETSGGGAQNGLTIYGVDTSKNLFGVPVFWDDLTGFDPARLGNGGNTLPNGRLSVVGQSSGAFRHTWGGFTSTSFGDEVYVDTYVYGLASYASATAVLASDDTVREAVELVKEVRNVTQGGVFGTNNTGLPGDVLEYRVTYLGHGDSYNVVLTDPLPLYTTLQLNQYGAGELEFTCPGAPVSTIDLAVASPNYGTSANTTSTSNGTTLRVTLTGGNGTTLGGVCNKAKLLTGQSGYLLFRVKIQ